MEVRDRLETGLLAPTLQVVDAGEIEKEVVPAARIVAQEFRERRPMGRLDLDDRKIPVVNGRLLGERRRGNPPPKGFGRGSQGRRLDDAHAGRSAANLAERLSRDFSPA